MKKLMFTAIALVAFSSVSMANTIADEEVIRQINLPNSELVLNQKVNAAVVKPFWECMVNWAKVYKAYLDMLGPEQAGNIADGVFDACINYPL
ncbi:hypothetical protein [Flavobacterium sp.]|uniref:hypothetical protein n=1 Tax=Flavobacterium sp. TaxID=239 RepID=UPI002631129B|nr:hypothetical protein [Flavobacterium sp.]